jgi:outer membrane protein OmpA-like peptidoglycan-associated protein
MSKNKKESFFWTSYSDLMTSLFFVMLVLFVLVIVLLHNKINEQAVELEKYRMVDLAQYQMIKDVEKANENIDKKYFEYNANHKKHVLKINVNFPVGKSDMNTIDENTQQQLKNAGNTIKKQINEMQQKYPNIQYLLIIEGQASKDKYAHNYELSYERALALSRFWQNSHIDFGKNCEVLISGSGIGGSMRSTIESHNQRFLIHIIPKTGEIEKKNDEN